MNTLNQNIVDIDKKSWWEQPLFKSDRERKFLGIGALLGVLWTIGFLWPFAEKWSGYMVASNNTVSAIVTIIRKHVDERTMLLILEDLKNVQGNESFRATVERMIKEAKDKPK